LSIILIALIRRLII